jgi:hypothetical protein
MSRLKCRAAVALFLSAVLVFLHTGVAAAADDGVQATLDHPIDVTQKAAVNALTMIGCTIKKEDPTYVEGKREHKVGVFVGSGGETVSVTLTPAGEGKVSINIRTKKSFVGMAGQKNWDQPVLDEMLKSLAAPAASAPTKAPSPST